MDEKISLATQKILRSIGLKKNEIKIYLDLIQYDKSSALEISKRTKIHRSNTYDLLRELVIKGFVKEIIENDTKLFKALDPKNIQKYIEEKKKEFEKVLPKLKKISKKEKKKDLFITSRGNFPAKQEIREVMNSQEEVLVWGISCQLLESIGIGFSNEFIRMIKERKGKTRVIFIEEKINNMDRKGINNKVLKEFEGQTGTIISGETMAFLVRGKPIKIMKITNKETAQTYKELFNLFWEKI